MLTADSPAQDGHLAASTPRRKRMDSKSNKHQKNLVQARLPFKRLNPDPKDNLLPKRPCTHACPDTGASDGENDSSAPHGPPLINGCGPLDGFLSRRRPATSDENIIDLTGDSSQSPIKHLAPPSAASPCLPREEKDYCKDKSASSQTSSDVDETSKTLSLANAGVSSTDKVEAVKGKVLTPSISELDTTQDSSSEPEEQNESKNTKNTPSASSTSSESSPENSQTDDLTPDSTPAEPKTTPKIPADQKIKRRSLKSLQEQEKVKQRQEKERQKEEAKAAKEKRKEEARKLKEEREREKREKKEKDEQEKRDKKEKEEKEKAEKVKAKEELRKTKIEAKLEEKRKKDEEKRVKEQKDRVKAEKAEITRFLLKSKIQQVPKTLASACGKFAPFEIKAHMALAPLCRVQCKDSVLEQLDQFLLKPGTNLNGLKEWIGQKPRRSGPTKPRRTDAGSECLVVEGPKPDGVPDRKCYGHMKLLKFHENYRPAYWGTWSKKSSFISPRCPLKQDKDLLDYEVDSDEEWEEEEPGESLSHSEGEDEEEGGEEDDEDDDGFFVPHGYLSNDEGAPEEEEGGDLEKQKLRQKLKAREWDELMSTKKKMKVLEPVVRGCVWEEGGPTSDLLLLHAVCLIEALPKADNTPSPGELSKKSQREAELLGQLLPLLHGNPNSWKAIISEFQEFCRQQTSSASSSSSSPPELSSPQTSAENIPSRIQLRRLIKNNAVYEKRSGYKRSSWYVHTEVLTRLGQEALPVPCQWTYLTPGARDDSREEPQAATGSHGNSPTTPQSSSTTPSSSSKRKSAGCMSITKFMKRCTDTDQTEATDAGFQADTEEDDEEDCVIVSANKVAPREKSLSEEESAMEVTPSETAALPGASSATSLPTD